MTYEADPGPKILFRTIGLLVVGFFLFMAAQTVIPHFYAEYQGYKLRQCEAEHEVADDAWNPLFGFDWGGRYIRGDNPENRALIKCIVESQSVSYSSEPLSPKADKAVPVLSIGFGSFSPGLYFEYFPGTESSENADH